MKGWYGWYESGMKRMCGMKVYKCESGGGGGGDGGDGRGGDGCGGGAEGGGGGGSGCGGDGVVRGGGGPGPLKCFCAPSHHILAKSAPQKARIATKLTSRQKCVN